MRIPSLSLPWRRWAALAAGAAAATLIPAIASAQYRAPDLNPGALGERYHVEVTGTLWNPDPAGQISSTQFAIAGSTIDLVNDLAYTRTRFKDIRGVLRPTKRAKFLIQYTPVDYTATTSLKRNIVFNGQNYALNLPIKSDFAWKVLRVAYEYDFLYLSRGFVGLIVEGRYTQFSASLVSPVNNEYTVEKAPLPALGVSGRVYPIKDLAINFTVTGFQVPHSVKQVQANYFDWDINGTVNVTNNVGLQAGWRRMTTFLDIKQVNGNLKFQGMWMGAVLRY
jgi:hypothetical protein